MDRRYFIKLAGAATAGALAASDRDALADGSAHQGQTGRDTAMKDLAFGRPVRVLSTA